MSYKGLSQSRLETPRTFTDRVYITDIVEILWRVIYGANQNATIKLVWRKSYFPWRIRLDLDIGKILLTGKTYGESTWTSAIAMQFSGFDNNGIAVLENILKHFVLELNRLPYESPYWTDEIWQKFTKTHKHSRRKVEDAWARYVTAAELMRE